MPFKPSAKKQIAKAQIALAETGQKLADIGAKRSAALLASDDNSQIIAFDREIEELKRVEKVQRDRIAALEREAEREEGLARAKRRSELIGRVKKRIAEADSVGAEMQAAADQLVKLFKRECELRISLNAMWPWGNDAAAIGLNGIAVKERLMWYLYKVGAVMNFGGGANLEHMIPSFPGGISPRLEDRLQAEKIPSLIEVMAEKTAYAFNVLDTGKVATGTAAPDPVVVAPRAPSAVEIRQAKLLAQINEASKDVNVATRRCSMNSARSHSKQSLRHQRHKERTQWPTNQHRRQTSTPFCRSHRHRHRDRHRRASLALKRRGRDVRQLSEILSCENRTSRAMWLWRMRCVISQ